MKVTCFYLHTHVQSSSVILPKCQLKDTSLTKEPLLVKRKMIRVKTHVPFS